MDETDLQILSSPGSLSESEIGIILKSQEDYRNLLKENHTQGKKIVKLEKLLSEERCSDKQQPDWVLILLGSVVGFLFGFPLSGILVANFAYENGQADGLKWKQELCQIKHPKSASAYQDCLNS